jgi:hypothetical protein
MPFIEYLQRQFVTVPTQVAKQASMNYTGANENWGRYFVCFDIGYRLFLVLYGRLQSKNRVDPKDG